MVHTALLVIDMQKAFDNPIWGERNNPQAEQQALRVLAYFRKHALPILHVQHISDNPQSQFHNKQNQEFKSRFEPVSYTHLRAHETTLHLVCRLLLEKKKQN